jgi:hypothetical protein
MLTLMGLFGPSREERHAAAARRIAPFGFVTDPARATQLATFLPLAELSNPERYCTAAFGRIEGADVAAFEYEYSTMNSDGSPCWYDTLLIAVADPRIEGRVSLRPDYPEWSTTNAVLNLVMWVPPFTVVKALDLLLQRRNPDRLVGHEEFDRLYVVHAASDADAKDAITPELCDLLPRLGFRGTLEIRPGLLLYTVRETRFDGETLVQALGYAAPLFAATARRTEYPYR